MSYILEALKRADAERDRGTVPTLHSHAIPAAAKAPPRTPVANWIAAIAVLALVAGAALWWTMGRQPAPAPVVVLPAASNPPVAAVVPTPAPVAPVAPATPVVPAMPATPAATVQPAKPAAPVAARKPAETPRATATATATARPAASAPATSAMPAATAASRPASAAAATQGVIYNVAELPDDIRAQLPKLSISGATYSAQAAYRMLIVNGQVLHEGDEPAPGLALEMIRQKDAVLRFKGYRYSVGY